MYAKIRNYEGIIQNMVKYDISMIYKIVIMDNRGNIITFDRVKPEEIEFIKEEN